MASAKLTLLGLMSWDPTIFDDAVIPEGMDRQTLIDTIVLRCADYEVLYPDWGFFKQASDLFFRRHQLAFTRWWDAMLLEYEPLYNYDRYEKISEADVSKDKMGSKTVTNDVALTDTSAYDSSSYQPAERATGDGTSNTDSTADRDFKHTADNHIYGNIGVTTSSAMLKEYLEMQAVSIYDKIADLFLIEMCIPVL